MYKNKILNKLIEQIPDIMEYTTDDKVKLVALHPGTKQPMDRAWNKKNQPLSRVTDNECNLGIQIGYNYVQNGNVSLSCIDIDGCGVPGETDKDEVERVKKITKDYIYNILKDIPGVLDVITQSGGHHLYLWSRMVDRGAHDVSRCLFFPDDFVVPELRGCSLGNGIEIFTREENRQCVLPGSEIVRPDGEIRSYGVVVPMSLSDVAVVDSAHDVVRFRMVEAGCVYREPLETSFSVDPVPVGEKVLNPFEVSDVVDILSALYPLLDGVKHEASLYLGGYLRKYVDAESEIRVCRGVVEKLPDLFKDPEAFVNTVVKQTGSGYLDKANLAGLPKLTELLLDNGVDREVVRTSVNRLANICSNEDSVFTFLDEQVSQHRRRYIQVNFSSNEIVSIVEEDRWSKKLNQYVTYQAGRAVVTTMVPVEISEIYDILNPNLQPRISISFKAQGNRRVQTVTAREVKELDLLLQKYSFMRDQAKSKSLFTKIIAAYRSKGMIDTRFELPVPGVFLNEDKSRLLRGDGDKLVPLEAPTKKSLRDALDVWDRLHNVFKADDAKLAHILRWGLVCPFSYILKTEYQWIPMLFIYGASRTGKTTLAEIALSPYTRITPDISVGGSSSDTEYRLGNTISKTGYGVIINEPQQILEKNSLLEMLKRATESRYCREKMEDGVHVRIPAYSNIIFTSNAILPDDDSIIRRMEFIEFTISERMTGTDQKEFYNEFNHVNWNKTDFLKLSSIGDFVCWHLSRHMELFMMEKNDFTNEILDRLFEYAETTPMEWLYQTAQLMDISAADDEITIKLNELLHSTVMRISNPATDVKDIPLNEEEGMTLSEAQDVEHIDGYRLRFKKKILSAIKQGYIPYLDYQNLRDGEYILFNSRIRNALAKSSGKKITLKALADYMEKEYKTYKFDDKSIKGFRLSWDEFERFYFDGTI